MLKNNQSSLYSAKYRLYELCKIVFNPVTKTLKRLQFYLFPLILGYFIL